MKYIIALILVSLSIVACKPNVPSGYDFAGAYQKIISGKMNSGQECMLIHKINEGVFKGEVTLEELGSNKIQFKLLDVKNRLRLKSDYEELLTQLNPSSEEYKSVRYLLDTLDDSTNVK